MIAFLKAALELQTAVRRVASQLPLRCGLSSGEVLHLTALHVDPVGDQLWIGDAEDGSWDVKTASRRRSAPIPSRLRADVEELAAGGGYLFAQPDGSPRSRTWLLKLVKLVCRTADVRVVSPHGLRDTYSSLLRARQRRSLADIGDVLGHADGGRTAARHYVGAPESRPELTIISGPIPGPETKKGLRPKPKP